MKSMLKILILSLVALPFMASADIKGDMTDSNMTLVQVVKKALDAGKSIDSIVSEMIGIEPSQSTAIVAAAVIADPRRIAKIIDAAVAAGADSAQVASSAIAASGAGSNANAVNTIVKAAISADPGNAVDIVIAASRVSDFGAESIASAAQGISRQVDMLLADISDISPVVSFNPTSTLGDIIVGLKDNVEGVSIVASPSA